MTTDTAPAAPAAPADTAAATAAPETAASPSETTAAPAPAPAATETADAKNVAPEDKGAQDKTPAEQAPEKYEFKAPEGREFNADVIGKFEGVARELNLSQDAAQKLLDTMGPQMQAAQEAQIKAVQTQWAEASKSDKEFGGEKLAENLGIAEKALTRFGSPELRNMLKETGLANHPEVIRAFFKIGNQISESSFVPSGAALTPTGQAASVMYPSMNKGN